MWPFRKNTLSLDIYMKSGSVIELDDITEYTAKNVGDSIVSLSIFYTARARCKLAITTIDLSQIEAIVVYR